MTGVYKKRLAPSPVRNVSPIFQSGTAVVKSPPSSPSVWVSRYLGTFIIVGGGQKGGALEARPLHPVDGDEQSTEPCVVALVVELLAYSSARGSASWPQP